MGRIVVTTSLTLDGVMQSPGRPDGDTRGGFTHGGWALPYNAHQTDNPFTDVLNHSRKYVASTTLTEPLPWANSTLLHGDVAQAVAARQGHRDPRQRKTNPDPRVVATYRPTEKSDQR